MMMADFEQANRIERCRRLIYAQVARGNTINIHATAVCCGLTVDFVRNVAARMAADYENERINDDVISKFFCGR